MRFERRNKISAETSLASISDIVFLLLIFFMISSTFVVQSGVKVELPKSASQKPSPGRYTVTIDRDGNFYWNANKVQREQVHNLIKAAFEKEKDPKSRVVTLRTDREVVMGDAGEVIGSIAELGGTVVIATKKK